MLAERITLEGDDVTAEYEAVESINLMTARAANPAYKEFQESGLLESIGFGCYHVAAAPVEE